MKRKLTIMILCVTIPILFFMAWFMSERSFVLSMEREKQRTQMTETIILREVQTVMMNVEYSRAVAYAKQYRDYYTAQGVGLVFCWNGKPIADAQLPNANYEGLLGGLRSAMLDTISKPQRYAVAEPIDSRLTMVLLRDVSDLYLLKARFQRLAFGAAAGAAVLLVAAALVFAGLITRPVRKLTDAAKELARHTDRPMPLPTARRDEIGALACAFADMQAAVETREAKLQEESESRQALLDALAHEMRTPLTSLLGNARLLQRDLPQAERAQIADSMAREIRRLTDMDQQLMKLTNLEHEPLEMAPVSIPGVLHETAARLREQADDIRIEVGGTDGSIPGDRELLSLLADNLTANAVHASEPASTVILTSMPQGFSVRDHGIGMSQEAIEHACEPFWKADKARTRRHGGAGLGLALCVRIAELHEGSLVFDSEPGQGTTVTFTTTLQPVDDSVTCPVA